MASKKLQVTVEEPLLVELEETMKRKKFYETSEFVKHCIREYLLQEAEEGKAPGGICESGFLESESPGGFAQIP